MLVNLYLYKYFKHTVAFFTPYVYLYLEPTVFIICSLVS